MKRLDPALILLCFAAFLAPVLGGQMLLDTGKMPFSGSSLVASMFMPGIYSVPGQMLIAVLGLGAGIWMLSQRKVLTAPSMKLASWLGGLLVMLVYGTAISPFKFDAIFQLCQWLSAAGIFLVTLGIVGRGNRSLALIGSVVAGCVVISILGINDYQAMRATDPTWRIFSTWIQPNALGGMLTIGLILATGLCLIGERLVALISGMLTLPIALALLLTQSRGALLSYGLGMISLLLVVLFLSERKKVLPLVARGIACFALVAALFLGLTRQQRAPQPTPAATVSQAQRTPSLILAKQEQPAPTATGGGAADRLGNIAGTSQQSVGFRTLLWKSCIKLISTNPVGSGLGSFQSVSAKPGLTTPTRFAHQSYLQLAVECSPVAMMTLIGILVSWIAIVLRGRRKLPTQPALVSGTCLAAVVTIIGNGLTESNLQLYGVLVTLFVLLAIGIQNSSDGSSPEYSAKSMRLGLSAGFGVVLAGFLYCSLLEAYKADARAGGEKLASALSLAPFDGELYSLRARTATDPQQALADYRLCAELRPLPKSYRDLAKVAALAGDRTASTLAFEKSLSLDPNNLLTLSEFRRALEKEDPEKAKTIAERTVKVEESEYYKVRSIPEVVPTETAEARIFLATGASSNEERIKLLTPALAVYNEYASRTWPNVKSYAAPNIGLPFGGETPLSASKVFGKALEATTLLLASQQALGSPTSETLQAQQQFEKLKEEATGLIR